MANKSIPAYVEIEDGKYISIEDAMRQPEVLEQVVRRAIKELSVWRERYGDLFDYLSQSPIANNFPPLKHLVEVGGRIATASKMGK